MQQTKGKVLSLTRRCWLHELRRAAFSSRTFELLQQMLDNYISGLPSPKATAKEERQLKQELGAIKLDGQALTIFVKPLLDDKKEPVAGFVKLHLGIR